MPLILRSVKGSNLTANEVDGNFTFLSSSIDNVVSGSVTVTSASYAGTASLAPNYLPLTGGTITGDIVVNGTGSFNYVVSNYESSSIIYSSGSTKFGDSQDDLHEFTGSVSISGSSLTLNNNAVVMSSQTSSMSVATASYVANAQTASYVQNAQTASYVENAQTASYVVTALTASYVDGANVNGVVANAESASHALSALTSNTSATASYVSGTFVVTSVITSATGGLFINSNGDGVSIGTGVSSSAVHIGKPSIPVDIVGVVNISGSLTSENVFLTGSLLGTSSYAINAETLDGLDNTSFVQTGSYNNDSGSFSARITLTEATSSDLAPRTTNLEATASNLAPRTTNLEATASNLVSASGSFSTRVTTLENASGSFSTRTTNLEAYTSSYSTTGSNTFIGNQTIVGDASGYAAYITTSVNDGTLGIDSTADINALYYLKSGNKKFELSFDTTNANPIFRLLPYTGSSFFEIGNPSNAGADYVFISEPTYGNVLIGPGLNNGDGQVTGATPLIHKVQIKGGMFVSGTIAANAFSGSINATNGVVSGSSQVISLLPAGTVSGSSQVLNGSGVWSGSAQLPSGVVSGSSQILEGSGIWSGSAQLPSGVVSGSSQVSYTGLSDIPAGIVSGSSQIDATATTNWATGIKNELNSNTVVSSSAQVYSLISSLNTYTGSNDSTNTTQNNRLTSLESLTGSYATTGSNTLVGTQYVSNTTDATGYTSTAALYTDGGLRVTKNAYFSSSMWIAGNITILGTQSIQYITSSQLEISDNIINVNTSSPGLRFGGIAVYDSGSTGLTGSFLWDSQNNKWIYSNPSGSAYDGGMAIFGPRNTSGLGNEQGTTSNALMKGQGGDHITSSNIIDDGSKVSIPYGVDVTGSLTATTLVGSLNGSNLVDASVSNAKLANSAITIAGNSTSLGSSISAATILSGTNTFTSSAQVTGLTNANLSGTAGISNANLANSAITIAGSSTSLGGSISAATIGNAIGAFSGSAQVNHNATTNYDSNQHVDHTAVSISAGAGLSGGGTIASTRTLTLDTGSTHFINGSRASISVSDTTGASGIDLSYNSGTGVLSGTLVNSAVTVTAGTGLSGGGSVSLGSSVTLSNAGVTSITSNTGLSSNVSATGAVTITNTGVTSNVAGTGISVSGATGAVTITNTGVTSVTAGTGISVNAGTGGVTITNTINNTNQLTNGAGYITAASSDTLTNKSGNISQWTNNSGYQTTSGTVTNLSGAGGSTIQSTSTGTSYTANYQIRENSGGSGNSSETYAPQLAFHHGGVVASSIMLESSGRIAIRNNPGTGYENFAAAAIYASTSITSAGDVTAYSDARVKENVNTIENALDKVLALRGVTYTRTDIEDKSEKIGVIAQETREVVPQVVSEAEDGKLSVAYGNLGGLFIEAFKQQQTLIYSQQSQIDELKELVNQLLNK